MEQTNGLNRKYIEKGGKDAIIPIDYINQLWKKSIEQYENEFGQDPYKQNVSKI